MKTEEYQKGSEILIPILERMLALIKSGRSEELRGIEDRLMSKFWIEEPLPPLSGDTVQNWSPHTASGSVEMILEIAADALAVGRPMEDILSTFPGMAAETQ